jgi:hypothetical protein
MPSHAASSSEITAGGGIARRRKLQAEVLQLAPADRSRLFERLIASLDSDADVERAWEEEADRRERELDTGVATVVPAQEAIARLRQRILR